MTKFDSAAFVICCCVTVTLKKKGDTPDQSPGHLRLGVDQLLPLKRQAAMNGCTVSEFIIYVCIFLNFLGWRDPYLFNAM